MKKKIVTLILATLMAFSFTACGSEKASSTPTNSTASASTDSEEESNTSAETTNSTPKDLPDESYQDMGTGTICLYTPGGSSENENIPIIFVDSETLIQIGLDSLDFDGSKLSYIYVDGMLATKEQFAHSQISLDLTGDMLSIGTHMVQVVQYDSDDPSGEMVTYKSASYEVKSK